MADDKDNSVGATDLVVGAGAAAGVGVGVSAFKAGALKEDKVKGYKEGLDNVTSLAKDGEKFKSDVAKKVDDLTKKIKKDHADFGLNAGHHFDGKLDNLSLLDANGAVITDVKDIKNSRLFTDLTNHVKPGTTEKVFAKAEDAEKAATAVYTELKNSKALGEAQVNRYKQLISGAEKYKNAKWYQAPVLGFEHMSTKGKIFLGAAVVASALAGTAIANSFGSGKEESAGQGR